MFVKEHSDTRGAQSARVRRATRAATGRLGQTLPNDVNAIVLQTPIRGGGIGAANMRNHSSGESCYSRMGILSRLTERIAGRSRTVVPGRVHWLF